MHTDDNKPTGVDERIERLICRRLDDEASAEERADLAGILARDPAARALFEEYQRIDGLAINALRRDIASASPAKARRRSWGIGVAGAAMTAAAVVALSFLPSLWPSDSRVAQQLETGPARPGETEPVNGMPTGMGGSAAPQMIQHSPMSIDYRDVDYRPVRRVRDVRRDLIGIRDNNNKNVIYIFEREAHSTRLVPVSDEI